MRSGLAYYAFETATGIERWRFKQAENTIMKKILILLFAVVSVLGINSAMAAVLNCGQSDPYKCPYTAGHSVVCDSFWSSTINDCMSTGQKKCCDSDAEKTIIGA